MYKITEVVNNYCNVVFTGVIIFLSALTVFIGPIEVISQNRKLPTPLKIKDSLEWGRFESHPARSLVEKAPILSKTDSKMIALELLGIDFDPKQFSKESKFNSYFKEYNAAKNEFQRKKLVPGIKEKFQARQRELSAIEEFLVFNEYGTLGEYSFTNKGFSFYGIESEFERVGISLENNDDKKLFPMYISVDESNAERILENNPSRQVVRYIIIKPTKGFTREVRAAFGREEVVFFGLRIRVPLEGIAVFAVVATAETKEVLAVYPE